MLLRRELKVNFKSFIIWLSILLGMFLIVFLMYPAIIKSDNVEMMNEMIKVFPEEMLKAFNMDISSLDSAFGFLKTEGFVFILLLTGLYASFLGSSIVLKEESDKTIEYLNSLPIKRSSILLQKILCEVFYIFMMIISIAVFNYIGLELSGDFNHKQYILLSITPLFSALPLFAINLFISTFMHKTKSTFGLCFGLALLSYFFNVLSEMSEVTEFLKYFTVYTLADIRNVIINMSINPLMILISMTVIIIFVVGTFIRYEKKELI